MLSSGQEKLKLKQELKLSNLFLQGSVGLEGKMNDERMISQTPMVHKLDVLSHISSSKPITMIRAHPIY